MLFEVYCGLPNFDLWTLQLVDYLLKLMFLFPSCGHLKNNSNLGTSIHHYWMPVTLKQSHLFFCLASIPQVWYGPYALISSEWYQCSVIILFFLIPFRSELFGEMQCSTVPMNSDHLFLLCPVAMTTGLSLPCPQLTSILKLSQQCLLVTFVTLSLSWSR